MKKKNRLLLFACCVSGMLQTQAQVPVTISAATGSGQDAQVWYNQLCPFAANTNFGAGPSMLAMAWTWHSIGCGYGELVSFLQFDLGAVPSNRVLEGATLKLYYPIGHINQQSGQNDLFIQRVTSPWQESVITWNTGVPSFTPVGQVLVPAAASPYQNYSINVSDIVREWLCNGYANYGFRIALQHYAIYRSAVFATREHPDTNLHPRLVLQMAKLTASATTKHLCNGGSAQLSASVNGLNTYTYSWTSSQGGFTSILPNPVVSPAQTTTYYVTATSANGCGSMVDSVTITVGSAAQSAAPTATPGSVCPGGAVQLAANVTGGTGPFTYSWTSVPAGFTSTLQDPVAYPLTDVVYYLTVTDTNGCSVSGMVSVPIMSTSGIVTASADHDSVCAGSQVQLSASVPPNMGTFTYSWSSLPAGFSSFLQDPADNPTQHMQYIVTATGGSCTVSDTVSVKVYNCCAAASQPYSKFYASFVDNFALHPLLGIEEADMKTNGSVLAASGIVSGSGLDGFLAEVDPNGSYIWGRVTGDPASSDRALCTKEVSTGDYILSGITSRFGNACAYLQKTDPSGNMLWTYIYRQTDHFVTTVNAAELNNGDFVIVGPAQDVSTSLSTVIVILTDPNGVLLSYNKYDVPKRTMGIVRDVTPTSDGGFILAGALNEDVHANDYVGALLMKFDASGSLQWWNNYRVNTPTGVYDLKSSNPDDRSQAVAQAVMEDAANNKYVAVGYAHNYDLSMSGTYWNGFIFEVDPSAGSLMNARFGNTLDNDIVSYRNIRMNAAQDYLVCGYVAERGTNIQRSLYGRYDHLLKIINTTYRGYSNSSGTGYNRAHSIFEEPGSTDVVLFGYDDQYGNVDPYVIRVDQNGNGSCPAKYYHTVDLTPTVDVPVYPMNITPVSSAMSPAFNSVPYCTVYNQQCTPQLRPVTTTVPQFAGADAGAGKVKIYPNPAESTITVVIDTKDTHPATLVLTDYSGRVISRYNGLKAGTNAGISVKDLPDGLYLITVQQNGTVLGNEQLTVLH